MSTTNEDGKQPENEQPAKQEGSTCCGPGCGCEAGAKSSNARWVIGVAVLVIAGLLVVRGMVRNDKGGATAAAGFVNPVAAEVTSSGTGTNGEAVVVVEEEKTVGATLGAFSELNTAAAKTDAVFVFIPGNDESTSNTPAAAMRAAARTIEAKGSKCALYTLKAGSADYEKIAKQVQVPAVLALVKGRGMTAVSGEVTEAKLLQGYVGACSSGGCGPSAGAGCCPK
jgi:hypothetical protein